MSTRAEREAKEALNKQHQAILFGLLERPENAVCADCKGQDPRWASWNLGIFICIECSGVHRSIGTHISRVKSVNLDTWTTEQVQNMQRWGNARANQFWEANKPQNARAISMGLASFIRAKYERREWALKGPIPTPPLPQDAYSTPPIVTEMTKKKKTKKAAQKPSSNELSFSSQDSMLKKDNVSLSPLQKENVTLSPVPNKAMAIGTLIDLHSEEPANSITSQENPLPQSSSSPSSPSVNPLSSVSQVLPKPIATSTSSSSTLSMQSQSPVQFSSQSSSSASISSVQALEDMFHGLQVFQPTASPIPTSRPSSAVSDPTPSASGDVSMTFTKKQLTKDSILSLYQPSSPQPGMSSQSYGFPTPAGSYGMVSLGSNTFSVKQ